MANLLDEIVLPDGTTRKLGNKIPKFSFKASHEVFGADPAKPGKLIPKPEWDSWLAKYESLDDFDMHVDACPVHDQNGVGQCNADDTVLMIEALRARQGLPYVQLSAADLYHRINGGVDEGSLLEDAMREASVNGVGTAATCGTLWKRGSFKGEASAAERQKYRITELFLCPTFEHCFSAVLQGFLLSTGIMWYSNFNTGSDGWLPTRGAGSAGGHAICGYKPTKATQHGDTYGIWHQNSWSPSWGYRGRMVIPSTLYGGNVGGWWAGRQVVDEGVAV